MFGVDGYCFGCNGTGRIEVVLVEEWCVCKVVNGAYQVVYVEFV